MLKGMHERPVKKVKGGHYVATNGRDTPDPPYVHANRGYWTDGEESHRAPSERTMSEYTITNERTSPPHPPVRKSKIDRSENGGPRSLVSPSNGPPNRIPPRAPSALSYDHGGDTGSDIYVTSAAYKAPSEIRVKGGHYVATNGRDTPDPPYVHANRGYWTDGEESHRAPSERTMSEYTITNERTSPPHPPVRKSKIDRSENGGPRSLVSPSNGPPNRIPPRAPSALSYDHGGDTGSDIYVTSAAYKAPSEISRYSVHRSHSRGPRSLYSVASSAKTGRSNRSRRAGAQVELMSAPNPFCPNVKGVCCLMLLLNLGLILVTLGFVIVIQFMEPLFVWVLGVIFLVFGFLTLIGSMIYCVVVCRDAKTPAQLRNEDLYWTRHWQKNIGYTPHEINYKTDRYDGYSDRYSVGKQSGKFSDRESNRY